MRESRQAKLAAMLEAVQQRVDRLNNPLAGEMLLFSTEKLLAGNPHFLRFFESLRHIPVGIEEFIDNDEFLAATDLKLWPEVRRAIIDINKYWWKGADGAINVAVLAGATGTGKTEIIKVSLCYRVYLLLCMKSPQAYWGLPSATSILTTIQGAKPNVTKKVVYTPLRSYFSAMPWFKQHGHMDRLVESECLFTQHNLRVVPMGGDDDAILGEAVLDGVIDEINFMNVVEKSKKAQAQSGRAGVYDQAATTYAALVSRKAGRFTSQGPSPGLILVSSSTRYNGEFTDRLIAESIKQNRSDVYVYRKAQYEVVPQDRFAGPRFRVAVANENSADTRILRDEEEVPAGTRVLSVPVEYRKLFDDDLFRGLRDICGVSSNAVHPFLRQRYRVIDAMNRGLSIPQLLSKDHVVLSLDGMPSVLPGRMCRDPSLPRYVHIDLAKNGDRAGIAMVRFDGMIDVARKDGQVERLPRATVEFALAVEPDANHEVDIAELRNFVVILRNTFRYPIRIVSYDGWNSLESRQTLKKMGIKSTELSVDRTSAPYKAFRDALYDQRINLPQNNLLKEELFSLEYDETKDKIDHPPSGSKDVADAVCGAYNILLTRSTTWEEMTNERPTGERPGAGPRPDVDRKDDDVRHSESRG